MELNEFSNEFDIFYNSITSNQAPGLDEYEKSVFLTEAQYQIATELYTGRSLEGSSFEQTEELRTYLRNLIKSATLKEQVSVRSNLKTQAFELPSDLLFIIYDEAVVQDDNAGCSDGDTIPVIPITWDSLHKTRNNPFRGPNKRRALRLDCGSSIIEVVSYYHIGQYRIKYLSKPTPIILADLGELSIDGYNTESECHLDPSIHRKILERAVLLAKKSMAATS